MSSCSGRNDSHHGQMRTDGLVRFIVFLGLHAERLDTPVGLTLYFLSSCTGWGKMSRPGSPHHILQQARILPLTKRECARQLSASPGSKWLYFLLEYLSTLLRKVSPHCHFGCFSCRRARTTYDKKPCVFMSSCLSSTHFLRI